MNDNKGLLGDPLMAIGLGLLSSNQRSPVYQNPMNSIMQNLQYGQEMKQHLTADQRDNEMHELKKLQIQKELNAEPEKKDYIGADGYRYYYGSNERVNPNITLPEKVESLPASVQAYQYAVGQGFKGTFQDWQINMANAKATKNTTNVNMPANFPYEVPSGFMPVDVNDPNKGVTPIPGSDKDELTPEAAAKVQMLQTAQDAYTEVKDLIYDENGDIDRENLFNAKVGMPFSEGRDLGVRMETGIQAITRAETGAAMPDTEVNNTKKRFMPSPLDSEKTIKLKLELYEDFISGSLDLIDPSGRFKEKEFEKEMKERKTARVTPKTWTEGGYEYRTTAEGKTQRRKL